MADAKDILGLPKTSFGLSSEKRSKPIKENPKKPDGVSREVLLFLLFLKFLSPT